MNVGDADNSTVSAYKLGWFAMRDPSNRPATRPDGSASHLQRHPVLVEVGISSFPVSGAGALSSAYRGAYSDPAIVLEETLARIGRFADVVRSHNALPPANRSYAVSEIIGVGVDEWMDRWDRSMDWRHICHDGVYVHSNCGPLISYGPKSSTSTPIAVERMGLNKQRDVAFRHCLQPRCTLAAWKRFAWNATGTATALKAVGAGAGEHILGCLNNSAAVDLGIRLEVCTELKPSSEWMLASTLLIAVTALLMAVVIVRGAKFELRLHNNLRRRGRSTGNTDKKKKPAVTGSDSEGSGNKTAATPDSPGDGGAAAAPAAAAATSVAAVVHRMEEFQLTGLNANPAFNDDSGDGAAGATSFSIKLVSSNGISPGKLETLLRAHVSVQTERLGEQIHAEIAAQRLLKTDRFSSSSTTSPRSSSPTSPNVEHAAGGSFDFDAVAEAVSVVYNRTLETYFSWKVWRVRSKTLNTGMLPAWLAATFARGGAGWPPKGVSHPGAIKYVVGESTAPAGSGEAAVVTPKPAFPSGGAPTPKGSGATAADVADVGSAYAEMLVLRVMESLSEQVLHAPERIASLFHRVRTEWEANAALHDAGWKFVINLDELHGGLSQLHANGNPYTDINFDDINDNGLDDCHESPMRKRWLEPRGVFVLFDIVRNFSPVIVIKHWSFTFMWFMMHADDYGKESTARHWKNLAVNSAIRDSVFCFVVEFLLKVVYTGMYQGADASVINARAYMTQHVFLSALYLAAVCVFIQGTTAGADEIEDVYVPLAYVYGVTRVACMFFHSLWAEYSYRADMPEGKMTDEWRSDEKPKAPWDNWADFKTRTVYIVRNLIVWLGILMSAAYWEVNSLVPMAMDAKASNLCPEECNIGTHSYNRRISVLSSAIVAGTDASTTCTACFMGSMLVWALVFATMIVDVFFIFNVTVAFVGYGFGAARGLENSHNTTVASLNVYKLSMYMKSLFGARWRQAWEAMCDSLYQDHVIALEDLNRLKAAGAAVDAVVAAAVEADRAAAAAVAAAEADADADVEVESEETKTKRAVAAAKADKAKQAETKTAVLLAQLPEIVRERLAFFRSTMSTISRKKEEAAARADKQGGLHGLDIDGAVYGSFPTLTQLIPVYDEDIILSVGKLRGSDDGVNTNLSFIITQYPGQWDLLAAKERDTAEGLYGAFMYHTDPNSAGDQPPEGKDERERLIMEVRLWASMRMQTVVRTIHGAVLYHQALQTLRGGEGASDSSGRSPVQLMLSHQTFGGGGAAAAERDIKWILRKWHDTNICVCVNYDSDRVRPDSGLKAKVESFMTAAAAASASSSSSSGTSKKKQSATTSSTRSTSLPDYDFKFASVLIAHSAAPGDDGWKVLHVLPRLFPLRIGQGAFQSQGKSANQKHALLFCKGHVLQMMDANMGAWMGEAFKVPFVMRQMEDPRGDRRRLAARILGFRETIFTREHSAVGEAMAGSEWTFGTIFQRSLDFLGVRMHYGHPDFMDGFWASNRGSTSKASPSLNVSEDMCAGLNLWLRKERSKHSDLLEWEKGREVDFIASSVFFAKISSGASSFLRTRDIYLICENMVGRDWPLVFL